MYLWIENSIFVNKGVDRIKILMQRISNNFWKDVLQSFVNLHKKHEPITWTDVQTSTIWNNPIFKINLKSFCFTKWINQNILFVADLINEDATFLTYKDFQEKYKIKINILEFFGVINSIKSYLSSKNIYMHNNIIGFPFIPYNIRCIL